MGFSLAYRVYADVQWGVLAGGGSQDAVLTGIQELKAGLEGIQAVVAESRSQTRQASNIKETDLEQVTQSLQCCVVWAWGDPTLESLLGPRPRPDEETAAWW